MASRVLHLTNGSAVIPLMHEAGITGRIVPWDDVLHEGPVPAGLNPGALRERRAAFLAACGWGAAEAIARQIAARDAAVDAALGTGGELNAARERVDEIVLWFEHDLYDQLQLLQILDRLPLDGGPAVTAVPDDDYLGLLPAERFAGLFAARRHVSSAQRLAARDGWTAFRSADPRAIVDVLPRLADLPRTTIALARHLEQFPSTDNGLSRTEHQALDVLCGGPLLVRDLYRRSHHDREPALFMGDAAFLVHLGALLSPVQPLIRSSVNHSALTFDHVVELTDDGRRVLAGSLDRVTLCGIDRWLGGVHLSGHGPVWRWDASQGGIRFR